MNNEATRACSTCKIVKLLEEFASNKSRDKISGRSYECRICERKRSREYYLKHKEKLLKKQKEYYKVRKEVSPEKIRARELVKVAVKSGKLIKEPCIVCLDTEVQGHHPDYSKPLEVKWLCVLHHRELHRADRTYQETN